MKKKVLKVKTWDLKKKLVIKNQLAKILRVCFKNFILNAILKEIYDFSFNA